MPPLPFDSSTWWASLKHGGLLIAPARLAERFATPAPTLLERHAEELRRQVTNIMADSGDTKDSLARLLDTVLETVCGLPTRNGNQWLKGSQVPAEWGRRALTGETMKPRRVWHGPNGAELSVFVDDEARLGIGRGRRSASRIIEWLRNTGKPLALLTNGRQWRLLHAGLDYDAWCEWDIEQWFESGRPGPQVEALQRLLSSEMLTPAGADQPAPLLAAILDSRRGQAELSAELGERVRVAVEKLIQSHGQALADLMSAGTGSEPRHAYLAATRVVMRMVVVLFAEAREDLLPRGNPVYYGSYSLEGLREWLERVGGGAALDRLAHRFGAWPRILGLFRLIHEGSAHPELPIIRYGGGLFRPGRAESTDPLEQALVVLEDTERGPSDATVYEILQLLTRARVRVRQGRSTTWVETPVDFSDLSSEYIGILYEGLLDFELRRAGPDDPVVFLNLGDEPALPLSRLESMDESTLPDLVKKLQEKRKLKVGGDDDEVEDEVDEEEDENDDLNRDNDDKAVPEAGSETLPLTEPEEPPTVGDLASGPSECDTPDARQTTRLRARTWARRVVESAKLVKKPRTTKPAALREYEAQVERASTSLIRRVILPGEWFLVRWGGTRKGAGTFYTRPALAVPTVQRTLRPLVYELPAGPDGHPDELSPAIEQKPRTPEEILALKLVDPAMGSGSFLVASLRYLTDALFESLHHHKRLTPRGSGTVATLAEGKPSEGRLTEEYLPAPPDAPHFEEQLRARLKRYVVERCLYGVDLDPLAVELARLALWIETMDRELPFEFLDHKLKVGNSLVGCWFRQFRHYPALAWERKGGDETHTNGVHYGKETWTRAIKEFKKTTVQPELISVISRQLDLFKQVEGRSPDELHAEAVSLLQNLHATRITDPDERARIYAEQVATHPSMTVLRQAFDTWCATWFWPAEDLATAPRPIALVEPTEATSKSVKTLADEMHFFHWEIEFPEVFDNPASGFHAVVGNPPWEIQKPNSKEFFSNLDPLYRAYGKQEALQKQMEFFTRGAGDERAWLEYTARFKALGNWCRNAAHPFGGGDEEGEGFSLGRGRTGAELHRNWASQRARHSGYADARHPFCHQGSADINTYKLFLEMGHALLRPGGRLAFIVPSGLYTDKGTTELRRLFLEECRWHWLFGFENRNKVFDIDSRFKFCPIIVEKGGHTESVLTAFMRRNLEDWTEPERHVIPYARAQVERFSPRTRAILEIRQSRDLEILEKIYANSVLLGDDCPDGWGIRYAREFDMTNDSKLFPPRPKWEADGYVPDVYGRWIKPRRVVAEADVPRGAWRHPEAGWIPLRDGSGFVREDEIEDLALPLYEGRMIGQFDFSQKGWVRGKGRGAEWREIPRDGRTIEPQYCMSLETYLTTWNKKEKRPKATRGIKACFMDITSSTNERTMIAGLVYDMPLGNSAPVLHTARDPEPLLAMLNSIVYDFAARRRCGGLHLNRFVVDDTPLLSPCGFPALQSILQRYAASLTLISNLFAPQWIRTRRLAHLNHSSWRSLWALTPHEVLRLRSLLDAVVACAFGLDYDDLTFILGDCDHGVDTLRQNSFTRTLDPKGFWRVDNDKDPELRQTVLTLFAFRDLKAMIESCGGDREAGFAAFCAHNDGEGWMLPEELRLSDLGLGHNERARKPQPVRERMGPRFLPWQLEQSAEESWAECERHARNILGAEGFAELQSEIAGDQSGEFSPAKLPKVAERGASYGVGGSSVSSPQVELFGSPGDDESGD